MADMVSLLDATTDLDKVARNLKIVKMYSLASFVMLFYDTVITLDDEVKYIWKKKFTRLTTLWFLNRYLSPLGFTLIIISFHSRRLTENDKVCNRIVFFPEILRVFTTITIGIIFIMRLYATYFGNKIVLVGMSCMLILEESVKIWAFSDGRRLQLPQGFIGCILTTGPNSLRFSFTWIAELGFDTLVFVLTLYRAICVNFSSGGNLGTLFRLIFRDGTIYFAVIAVANLATSLTFVLAPPDLKAINASFSVSITPLMISRLILNLRSADSLEVVSTANRPLYFNEYELETLQASNTADYRHPLCPHIGPK